MGLCFAHGAVREPSTAMRFRSPFPVCSNRRQEKVDSGGETPKGMDDAKDVKVEDGGEKPKVEDGGAKGSKAKRAAKKKKDAKQDLSAT